MPELPEVELARRNLERWLAGRRLTEVQLPPSRILRGAKPGPLRALLVGETVRAVERRGKWLRLLLGGGAALYSHLGMTGKWVARGLSDGPVRFERARFDAGKRSVRYLDPRLFGRLVAARDGGLIPEWRALGPDPLVDGLDADGLAEALGRTRRSIKEALLDQTLVAGIGNIQAAEALWRARIDPRLRADRLAADRGRLRALLEGIDHRLHAWHRGRAGDRVRRGAGRAEPVPRLRQGRRGVPAAAAGSSGASPRPDGRRSTAPLPTEIGGNFAGC